MPTPKENLLAARVTFTLRVVIASSWIGHVKPIRSSTGTDLNSEFAMMQPGTVKE